MKLKVLSSSDCEQVRQWRNSQTEMLRTSFPLTQEQQIEFYRNIVCNRQANARYWGIWIEIKTRNNITAVSGECKKDCNVCDDCYYDYIPVLIGMCGLENIQWENCLAEISLIFNPEYSMDEYGEEALMILLHEGFMNINLKNIYAEIYECNPYYKFWIEQVIKHAVKLSFLPDRKYLNGKYYGSIYLNFNKECFYENIIT